jgi:hypothetical protein
MPLRRHPHPRLLTATAALAAVLIPAAALASSAAGQHPSATPVARCARSQLTAWMALPSAGAAALTDYFYVEITNASRHACSLDGFLRVTAVGLNGLQIGGAALRATSVVARYLVLAPGATSYTSVGITSTSGWSRSGCNPRTAYGLSVTAPHTHGSLRVGFSFGACAEPSARFLSVFALQPGVGISSTRGSVVAALVADR